MFVELWFGVVYDFVWYVVLHILGRIRPIFYVNFYLLEGIPVDWFLDFDVFVVVCVIVDHWVDVVSASVGLAHVSVRLTVFWFGSRL